MAEKIVKIVVETEESLKKRGFMLYHYATMGSKNYTVIKELLESKVNNGEIESAVVVLEKDTGVVANPDPQMYRFYFKNK